MPFQKSPDPKTERIVIKVTPSEKALIEADAKARHLTVAAFALRRMLGKQTPVQSDRDAIDLLSKVVLELRALNRDGLMNASHEAGMARVRDEAVEAIQMLWERQP